MNIGRERRKQARKDAPENASKRKERNRRKRGLIDTNLGKTLKTQKGGIFRKMLDTVTGRKKSEPALQNMPVPKA